jgi:acetoin utilization deacetylase AcuC-like enzyme
MKLIMNGVVDDSGHEEAHHPERPQRLNAVLEGIGDLHLGDDLFRVAPRLATRSELALVHDTLYLDELGAFCYEGGGELDPDTYATYDTWSVAHYAAGAGLAVSEELNTRNEGIGFVAARPPGHHALRNRAMGFCLLNNVAVAAAQHARRGERVLILDWDVHHGNGTQSIFWEDPNVLYVSTHEWPLYPGTGAAYEIGGLNALDKTVNLPMPSGVAGDVLYRALVEVAGPTIEQFAPTWVLVSAGFDAHRADPLASLELSGGDFGILARLAQEFTPRPGRLALFLEGGYDLHALRTSVASVFSTLLDVSFESERTTEGAGGADVARRLLLERDLALNLAYDARTGDDQIS